MPRKIARPVDPFAWSHKAAGSHRRVGPPGTTDRKNVPMPSRKTFEIPGDPESDHRQDGLDRGGPQQAFENAADRGSDDGDLALAEFAAEPESDAVRHLGEPLSLDVEHRRDEERQRELQEPDADSGHGRDQKVLDGFGEGPQLLAKSPPDRRPPLATTPSRAGR